MIDKNNTVFVERYEYKSINDLLNKIANGEEVPEKIKYNKKIYTRFRNNCGNTLYYYQVYGECDFLLQNIELVSELNDEVEILEDDFIDIEEFIFAEVEETAHYEMKEKINALIENQNKIIERLDKNEY